MMKAKGHRANCAAKVESAQDEVSVKAGPRLLEIVENSSITKVNVRG